MKVLKIAVTFFVFGQNKTNNVLDRKETIFDHKRKISKSHKNRIFPKGLTHAFGQKMPIFSLFCLA